MAAKEHPLSSAITTIKEDGPVAISNEDRPLPSSTTRCFVGNWFSCLLLGWQVLMIILFATTTKLSSAYMPKSEGAATSVSTGATYAMFQVLLSSVYMCRESHSFVRSR